jgi:hypothetical protein
MSNDKLQNLPKTEKWLVVKNLTRNSYDILEPHLGYCNVIAEHLSEDTAAFIVKACNLHESLLDTLTDLTALYASTPGADYNHIEKALYFIAEAQEA